MTIINYELMMSCNRITQQRLMDETELDTENYEAKSSAVCRS